MSFTKKIDVLELLIELLHEHTDTIDTLVGKIEIVENTIKNSPIKNKSIDYEGTLLEDKLYKTILVVDDDKDLAKTFKIILNEAGFIVELAYTGTDALRRMYNKEYDLVILDLNLPDMLGNEVAERMRNNWINTEYMYITGYSGLKQEVSQSDKDQVLTKPIEPEKLIEVTSHKLLNYLKSKTRTL